MGSAIILFFVFLGQILVIFDEYVFYRIGVNRNFLMAALWILPFLAAFTTSFYLRYFSFWLISMYIIALPLLAAMVHYLYGELGGVVDFSGIPGAFVIFNIFFVVGAVVLLAGAGIGVLASQIRARH
jgi:hypothetical protein